MKDNDSPPGVGPIIGLLVTMLALLYMLLL